MVLGDAVDADLAKCAQLAVVAGTVLMPPLGSVFNPDTQAERFDRRATIAPFVRRPHRGLYCPLRIQAQPPTRPDATPASARTHEATSFLYCMIVARGPGRARAVLSLPLFRAVDCAREQRHAGGSQAIIRALWLAFACQAL